MAWKWRRIRDTCIRQGSSEKQLRERERERKNIHFKELAHVIVGTGNSKICRADQQARYAGKHCCCNLESENNLEVECFLPQGTSNFSLMTFNWLVKPHQLYEDYLICFTQPTNLNVNYIQKNTFTATFRLELNHTSGHYSLAKLTSTTTEQ